MGYIWYLLLQPGRGVFNNFVQLIGHPEWFGNWQASYSSCMIVLILVNVWQYAGMTMIIYLAGLQNISKEYFEACKNGDFDKAVSLIDIQDEEADRTKRRMKKICIQTEKNIT